jgi:hypothetical protein
MASPKLVIEAIKQRCAAVDPRFDGYEKELLTTVSDILSREREHKVSPTTVQQKVQDHIEVLGDQIWRRSEGKA